MFFDGKLHFEAVDSLGCFKIKVPKKDEYSVRVLGWGYENKAFVKSDRDRATILTTLYGDVNCEVNSDST